MSSIANKRPAEAETYEADEMTQLQRTTFETSRAAEYFDGRQLSALTGVPQTEFASVCLKELVDNALDACMDGVVYLTYTAFDEAVGDEVERIEALPCRRCLGNSQ